MLDKDKFSLPRYSECLFMDIIKMYGRGQSAGGLGELSGRKDLWEYFFDALIEYINADEPDFGHYDGGNKYFHVDFELQYFDYKIRDVLDLVKNALDRYTEENGAEIDTEHVIKFLFEIREIPSLKIYDGLFTLSFK